MTRFLPNPLPFLALCLAACQPDPRAPAAAASGSQAPVASAGVPAGAKLYGAPLDPSVGVVPLGSVLDRPEDYADRPITVEGAVRKACTKKGCWMEIALSSEPGTAGARVTFKDYGFFVPTDSAGSRARVQGTVTVKTLPASRVEHLEAEGATFPKKAEDGTAREVQFVATGVELSRS